MKKPSTPSRPAPLAINTVAEMRAWSEARRAAGERVAFVPTLGALHEGHAALLRRARREADRVVVSLFVNPTQFNDVEDFEKYPRTTEADLAVCAAEGVAAVFLPSVAELYPRGATASYAPGPLADHLCGPRRPGHFAGVMTVVARLFDAVRPDVAVFGEKDYQQLQIIRRLVADEQRPIRIVALPTVREPDGLALSSRNARLTREGRGAARAIPKALQNAADLFGRGERRAAPLVELCRETLRHLAIDYVELVDAQTLQPVTAVERPAVLAVAVFVDAVRLIDNVLLQP